MENKAIFETKGTRNVGSTTLAAILIVPCLVMLPVSIFSKGETGGPYYLYVGGLIACIAYIYFVSKKNRVVLKVQEGVGDEIIFSMSGSANENNIEMKITEYAFWYRVRHRSRKSGGNDLLLYFLGQNAEGEKFQFTRMAQLGQEPKGWPRQKEEFAIDAKTFDMEKLPELVKCLEAHERRQKKK